MEPVEHLTIDVPEEFVGVVMEQLGIPQGRSHQHAQSRLRPRTH